MGDFADALSVFRANRRLWDVKHMAPTFVRAARVGAVAKVVGVIESADAIPAPLTLQPCVAFRVRAEEDRPDLGMRRLVATGDGHVPFYLVDDEGRRIRVEAGEMIMGASFEDVTARAAIHEKNAELRRVFGTASFKEALAISERRAAILLEDRIVAGDRVAVCGIVGETTEVMATGYRDAVGRGLCLGAGVDEPLVLSRS